MGGKLRLPRLASPWGAGLGLILLVAAGYGLRRAAVPAIATRRAAPVAGTVEQSSSCAEAPVPTPSATDTPGAPDVQWADRLHGIRSRVDAQQFTEDLRHLPTGESARIVRSLLSAPETGARGELLLDFLAGDTLHPQLFEILVDVARTATGPPRYRVLRALGDLTFLDLAEDPSLLNRLVHEAEGLTSQEALRHAAGSFVDRLRAAPPEARGEILMKVFALAARSRALAAAGVPAVFRERGLPEMVMDWIKANDPGPTEANVAHAWIRAADPPPDFLRQYYLPVIEQTVSASFDSVRAAALALGRAENAWAVEPLIVAYVSTDSEQKQRALSDALDRIVREPWLPWFHQRRESLGPEVRRLELPRRHAWEPER